MKRVAITGVGIVSPLGSGIEKAWRAAKEGVSGIREITRFDIKDFPVRIAGEVPDFDPGDFIEKKELKKMDLFIQYAVVAALMAYRDSGFTVT